MKYLYDLLFFIGLLIWLGGTWYFGWNETAVELGEKITDSLGGILMIYGGLNSFVRGIKTDVIINHYK